MRWPSAWRAAQGRGRESVGLGLGARTPSAELAGSPQLSVGGLADDDARVLPGLESLTGPVDGGHVATGSSSPRRAATPLALLELPQGPRPRQSWRSGSECRGVSALPGSVEESFRRRAEALPADARRPLLRWPLCRTSPVTRCLCGGPPPYWGSALQRRGRPPMRSLAEIGARVRFRHPLVRSAIYLPRRSRSRHTSARRLGRGHRSADRPETTAPGTCWPGRPGPDEAVASELERKPAGRAQHAPAWPLAPRSSSGPRRLRPIPKDGRGGHWLPPTHRYTPVHPTG